MNFLLFLSNAMIPLVIFVIVGYGVLSKVSVFDAFVKGAGEGIKTVFGIAPTLIGLMVGVGILRSSGALEAVSSLLAPASGFLHFPKELFPLVFVKLFSSSAATGLLLDIYKNYGCDSYLGFLASILMSCSETVFYTMSVYFIAAEVKKVRWTLAGALLTTLAGIVASLIIISFIRL